MAEVGRGAIACFMSIVAGTRDTFNRASGTSVCELEIDFNGTLFPIDETSFAYRNKESKREKGTEKTRSKPNKWNNTSSHYVIVSEVSNHIERVLDSGLCLWYTFSSRSADLLNEEDGNEIYFSEKEEEHNRL
ncbi:hypothetical protein EI42_00681 [Thermosporothrix hazakensis]|uniref:Uncharacterized protein n=1 Tax=Thermosporothrix hazakensis TaxID=644383 RepID=A0A326UF04_THEHA|nr:hypothetical protein [Thermosporothrix hazakensis]PZW36505.1 hypothetical protein EI42_00681 [Thermosporothrix hazakensis]GCE47158.1 hypothetical protein KTH_20270 [Thermosporothrix hazakensis]